MRTGVIARKLGMSRVYNDRGDNIPVTLLKLDGCEVVSVKTQDKNGYDAVQLGAGEAKVKNVSKALRGHFAKAKVAPKKKVVEFRVSSEALLQPGQRVTAGHYVAGQYVDVVGISKGKGFAGAMKRHNFGGLEATHGVSISHRSHGSTGQCQDPGRVFKGKKMAGHLGSERTTVQNLEVILVDVDDDLVVVNGSVPGAKGDYIIISDAIKKALPSEAPYPAGIEGLVANANEAEGAEQKSNDAEAAQNEAPADAAPQAEAAEEAPKAEAAPQADEKKTDEAAEAKDDVKPEAAEAEKKTDSKEQGNES